MPKVSKQTAAKGGLMTAILGMIGNVVGIGIFFKNGTVFKLNDATGKGGVNASAIGVLISWIVATIIVLCMAISFAEIASCKTRTGKAGVGPWAEEFCGHKFGRYSKLGYALIFWPINTFAVMFFAGEALLNCFAPLKGWDSVSSYNYGYGTVAYIFAIGAVLFLFFILINYFKFKSMAKVGKGISYVKFAPIAMVVLIGIIAGAIFGGGLWTREITTTNAIVDTTVLATENAKAISNINWVGAFSCIPAILFSFEGYVAIDSFKNDLSNPDKQIPAGVVVGVIVIAVLYFAVTIGCITAGTGNVYSLMQMFKDKVKGGEVIYKVFTMLISIFIFTCLIGCVNGMARGGITAYQELSKQGDIFVGKKIADAKPGNDYFAGAISFSIIVGLWFALLLLLSLFWNSDAIADGSSTSMIVCLYVIYGGSVLAALINRKTKKVQVAKNKLFPVAAVIGLLGCLFMVGYVAFYQFTIAPIQGGWHAYNSACPAPAGWGMFVKVGGDGVPGSYNLKNGEVIILFWSMTIIAALSPLINDGLIKGLEKSNKTPLMWDKVSGTRINQKAIN